MLSGRTQQLFDNAAYFSVRLGAEQRDAVVPLARAAAAQARSLCEVRVNPNGSLELSYDGTDLVPQEFVVWLEPDGRRGVSVIDQEP